TLAELALDLCQCRRQCLALVLVHCCTPSIANFVGEMCSSDLPGHCPRDSCSDYSTDLLVLSIRTVYKLSGRQPLNQACECRLHGGTADCLAIPAELAGPGLNIATLLAPGYPHQPHRLVRRAPVGAGDSADGNTQVCARPADGALRHGLDHRLADRAMRCQVVSRYAKHLLLGLVRVGDEAALEPLRAARHRRDRLGDPATGAGFRRGQLDPVA